MTSDSESLNWTTHIIRWVGPWDCQFYEHMNLGQFPRASRQLQKDTCLMSKKCHLASCALRYERESERCLTGCCALQTYYEFPPKSMYSDTRGDTQPKQ